MTTLTNPIATPLRPANESTARGGETSPRTAALIAGFGYIALFALGIFANFFVREGLIVTDDPAATAVNIAESVGLFRLGMISFS